MLRDCPALLLGCFHPRLERGGGGGAVAHVETLACGNGYTVSQQLVCVCVSVCQALSPKRGPLLSANKNAEGGVLLACMKVNNKCKQLDTVPFLTVVCVPFLLLFTVYNPGFAQFDIFCCPFVQHRISSCIHNLSWII